MTNDQTARDIANRPMPFALVWGIPIAIVISMNFAQGYLPFNVIVLIMATAVAWMGLSCVINAARCGRLHCKFSGPIFLVGAAGILASGFGLLGAPGTFINEITWGTFALALSTYGLEFIWGPYGKGREAR